MDDGRQTLAWTQTLPWSVTQDPPVWDVVWAGTVDDARRRFAFISDGRAQGPMHVEVEHLWWLDDDDWVPDDDEDDEPRGGLFGEPAVRISVGPVIGPLPAPTALYARFSTQVAALSGA